MERDSESSQPLVFEPQRFHHINPLQHLLSHTQSQTSETDDGQEKTQRFSCDGLFWDAVMGATVSRRRDESD